MRPIALQSLRSARSGRRTAHPLPDHARGTDSIFIGFQRGRIDIPQPARRLSSPTLAPARGKRGKRVPETEEALRARWRPARETPKEAGCPPSGRRRSPASITIPSKASPCNRCRVSRWHETHRVRRSHLRVGVHIDEARRHRDLKLRVRWKPFERSVLRLDLPSRRIRLFGKRKPQNNRMVRRDPGSGEPQQIAAREAASHARNPGRGH